jgi:hypothetical protein
LAAVVIVAAIVISRLEPRLDKDTFQGRE